MLTLHWYFAWTGDISQYFLSSRQRTDIFIVHFPSFNRGKTSQHQKQKSIKCFYKIEISFLVPGRLLAVDGTHLCQRTNCSSSYYIKFLMLLWAEPGPDKKLPSLVKCLLLRCWRCLRLKTKLVTICLVKNVAWELRTGNWCLRTEKCYQVGGWMEHWLLHSSLAPPHHRLDWSEISGHLPWSEVLSSPLLSLLCQSWDVTTKARRDGEVWLGTLYDVDVFVTDNKGLFIMVVFHILSLN